MKYLGDMVARSFLLTILILLNFLLVTAILVVLSLYTDFKFATLTIQRENGLRWIIITFAFILILITAIEWSQTIQEMTKRIPRFLWGYISANNIDDLSIPNRKRYNQMKEIYAEIAIGSIPVAILGLATPLLIGYTYTNPLNFSAVSVLFIGFGILIGSFQTAVNRQVVRSSDEASFEQEMSEIVANQLEALLLLASAVTQIFGIYNVGTGEIPSLAASVVIILLLIVLPFGFYLYLIS